MKLRERNEKGREKIARYTKMWLGMKRGCRAQCFDGIQSQHQGTSGL